MVSYYRAFATKSEAVNYMDYSATLKIRGFSRCNEGTIVDGAVNNPKSTGCNVKATTCVLKFPQVQGSLQIARKVALDRVAY